MPVATDTLNNGHSIPVIGLGCWMGKPGKSGENEEAEQMVANAIKAGYTHFDTASGYGNEEAVGSAILASGVPRETLFVTTKLGQSDHVRVAEAFEKSLSLLNVAYIDLYLMHWPQANDPVTKRVLAPEESPTINETWDAMTKLLAGGKVKSIGVSNFSIKLLDQLATTSKVIPSVNQVESHPYHPQVELSAYCKSKGIHLTAYCPLGQYDSPILAEKLVGEIAAKHGKTTGQVLLSWNIQRGGWSAVPKSSNPERMAQNLVTFTLSPEEATAISKLHEEPGKTKSLCAYVSGRAVPGSIFGWTLAQMGWDPKPFTD